MIMLVATTVIMVVMIMVMAVAIPMFVIMAVFVTAAMIVVMVVVIVVMVMIMMIMVVTSASAVIMVMVVVVMVVAAVAFHVLVQLVIETGVVDGMVHPVFEFVFIHIEDGAHEVKVDLLARFECSVVLHAVVHVCEVQSDAVAVIVDDGRFDVAQKASGLVGDPLSDLEESLGESGFRVGVEACERSLETDGTAACLLDGCRFVVFFFVFVAAAFVFAHLIIS